MVGIELEKAIELLNEVDYKPKTICVDLLDSMNRICSEDIYADMDNPPFDRSPLDGYALKSKDSEKNDRNEEEVVDVIGTVYAGECFNGEIKDGQAVRIMTGAPMPKGSDCVIRQEDTDYGKDKVKIYKSVKAYGNYCFKGEDIQKGTSIITKGTKISYQHIGVLASMGVSKVKVVKPLTIGLISTGDEVIDITEELKPGKIYNTNRYIIGAKLNELGIKVKDIKDCGDNTKEVSQKIEEEIEKVDMILTTGGVSVGVKDIMHDVLKELGAERLFWKVNIQPGTPAIGAKYNEKLLICLSGNPFAAIATFELIVRPVLAKMSNDKDIDVIKTEAVTVNEFHKKSKKRRFIRAKYKDGIVEIPGKNHSSGAIFSMLECNALIDIEKGNEGLKEGEKVNIVLI